MVSAGASQKIFRPSLSEMLPRWQTAVEVWPVSTSLMHRARDLTHLRKSCTWGQFWSQLPPHFGSNGVLHSKQERGGQADLVWLSLHLARSGPDHNMETDSAGSAADSTRGRERNGPAMNRERTEQSGLGGGGVFSWSQSGCPARMLHRPDRAFGRAQ